MTGTGGADGGDGAFLERSREDDAEKYKVQRKKADARAVATGAVNREGVLSNHSTPFVTPILTPF
jgi:hypothetical protein